MRIKKILHASAHHRLKIYNIEDFVRVHMLEGFFKIPSTLLSIL